MGERKDDDEKYFTSQTCVHIYKFSEDKVQTVSFKYYQEYLSLWQNDRLNKVWTQTFDFRGGVLIYKQVNLYHLLNLTLLFLVAKSSQGQYLFRDWGG